MHNGSRKPRWWVYIAGVSGLERRQSVVNVLDKDVNEKGDWSEPVEGAGFYPAVARVQRGPVARIVRRFTGTLTPSWDRPSWKINKSLLHVDS